MSTQTTATTATAHSRMAYHLAKYAYKRGQHKGDAPFYTRRPAMRHVRVVKRGDNYAVVMYCTDILTAYPDGSVRINTRGFYNYPTTRARLRDATYEFCLNWASPYTVRLNGYSNTAIHFGGKNYPYTDGMIFDANNQPVGDYPRVFKKYVVDRKQTQAFYKLQTTKDFRRALPLIHSALSERAYSRDEVVAARERLQAIGLHHTVDLYECVKHPELWGDIVTVARCLTHEETWKAITNALVSRATNTIDVPIDIAN